MSQMSGMERPAEGLVGFWGKITGARRRHEPAPAPERRDVPGRGNPAQPIPLERAAAAQPKRRVEITGQALLAFYFGELKKGDYPFRKLKEEFDELCDEAEVARVSDRQLGLWLTKAGGVKYRAHKAKVTMYHIKPPRRLARAA